MVFSVSEEVTVKEGGPRMIVTGYSSGMVECRWYDGFGVKREAFHENELVPGKERRVRDEDPMTKRPVNAGRFCCGEKESSRCDMLLPGYARIEWYPLMRSGYRKPSGGVVSITRSYQGAARNTVRQSRLV